MRITHGVMVNGFLTDMNTNLNQLNKIQNQLNTGKVFSKPSDDPFKVARSMQMYSEINANKQYNTNIKDTINWMDTTDTALSNSTKVLQRIRELMVSAGNAAYGSSELSAIKDEINERVAEFGQILNTSFDGKYIFGGKDGAVKPVKVVEKPVQVIGSGNAVSEEIDVNNLDGYTGSESELKVSGIKEVVPATTPAKYNVDINGTSHEVSADADGNYKLDVDGLELDFTEVISKSPSDTDTWDINLNSTKKSIEVNGDENLIDKNLKVEISSGVTVDYNANAMEILKFKDGDGNDVDVMKFLDDLVNNLSSEDGKSKVIGENLDTIDKISNNMLTVSSRVGTVQNRMESAKDLNEAQNENMTDILSSNEDINFVEKAMEMAVAQTVYVAALQTSAKVLQPTILNYL